MNKNQNQMLQQLLSDLDDDNTNEPINQDTTPKSNPFQNEKSINPFKDNTIPNKAETIINTAQSKTETIINNTTPNKIETNTTQSETEISNNTIPSKTETKDNILHNTNNNEIIEDTKPIHIIPDTTNINKQEILFKVQSINIKLGEHIFSIKTIDKNNRELLNKLNVDITNPYYFIWIYPELKPIKNMELFTKLIKSYGIYEDYIYKNVSYETNTLEMLMLKNLLTI